MIIQVIGYLSSIIFAVALSPQVWRTYKTGNAKALAPLFLHLSFSGEALMAAYIILQHSWDLPLLISCFMNMLFLSVIYRYLYWPRKRTSQTPTSWAKTIEIKSEIDKIIKSLKKTKQKYKLSVLEYLEGRGVSNTGKRYPIRKLEFDETVLLEYMKRTNHPNDPDIIISEQFSNDSIPLTWSTEIYESDEENS